MRVEKSENSEMEQRKADADAVGRSSRQRKRFLCCCSTIVILRLTERRTSHSMSWLDDSILACGDAEHTSMFACWAD